MKLTTLLVAIAASSFALGQEPGGDQPKKGDRPGGHRGPSGPMPKEMIAKFDKDGDGKLNAEERKAAMDARKTDMLKKYDKDGDGKLSGEERKAAMIKKFDKDGDGKLNDDEKQAMREEMRKRGGRGDRPGRGNRPGGKGKGKGKGKPGSSEKPKKADKPADEQFPSSTHQAFKGDRIARSLFRVIKSRRTRLRDPLL